TDQPGVRRLPNLREQHMSLQRWNWLIAELNGRAIVGMPGVRDLDDEGNLSRDNCDAFDPGTPGGTCSTDGHYMCDECTERKTCDGGCGKRPSQCECPESEAPNA